MSKIALTPNASGTGTLTIAAPNTNTDRTLTLPDNTGTVVLNEGSGIFKIDSSGNVGIGTASSATKLGVEQSTTSVLAQFKNTSSAAQNGNINAVNDAGTALRMQVFGSAAGSYGMLSAGSPALYTSASELNFAADNASGVIKFATGSSVPERARITAGGFLLSGTTSDLGGQFNALGTGRDGIIAQVTSNSNSPYLGKNASGSIIYILSGLGTIYAVNTTVQSVSDVRTKENIKDSTDGLQVVMGLRPRRFDFKAGFGGDRKDVLGFVAQEIEQVFPDAVDLMPSGSAPDDPEEPYKSVGPGALIPVLVKAIQEQQALITALTARVAELEAK